MQVYDRDLDYVTDTNAAAHLQAVERGLYYMTCFP